MDLIRVAHAQFYKIFSQCSRKRDCISKWHFICPFQINLIYVVFDEPVTVSMVKVWNYSKTPIRGVQQFGVRQRQNVNVHLGILHTCCPCTVPGYATR